MSNMNPFKKFKKFFLIVLASLGGTLAITGCSAASTIDKFPTTEAEELNDFTDAFNAQDAETMRSIIKKDNEQYKTLANEAAKAEKYGKPNADKLKTQTIMLGNKIDAMEYAYKKQTGTGLGDNQPGSTDFFTNALDLIGDGVGLVGDVLSGNPVPTAVESAQEYAQTNPEWQDYANAMKNFSDAVGGQKDNSQTTNGSTGSQSTNEALDQAADKINEVGDGAVRKGKEFVDWVKEKAQPALDEAEKKLDEVIYEDENARQQAEQEAANAAEAEAKKQAEQNANRDWMNDLNDRNFRRSNGQEPEQ